MVETTAARQWISMVGLLVASVGLWAAWLGWDTRRDVDPVTGAETGPYEPGQIVGLVLCLAVLAALAARWLHPARVTVVMAIAVTAAFAVTAASDPAADGLWPIGAALVLFAALAGVALCSGLAYVGWQKRYARRTQA